MRVIERLEDLPLPEKAHRGFVPTMGYLHEGHLRLLEVARRENEELVLSVFVNPLQFGPKEDYERYPRDLERDRRLAEDAGVDILFAPTPEEMYGTRFATRVEVGHLGEILCGAFRPGHFSGVATVVVKLFNLVRPTRAYFGEKDYQQSLIVRQVVRDLNLPVEIRTIPTVREADGLAKSSRNVLLGPDERRAAPTLYRALREAREVYRRGERENARLRQAALAVLAGEPLLRTEYVEVVDPETLGEPVPGGGRLILAAVWLGSTRLIDNLRLDD